MTKKKAEKKIIVCPECKRDMPLKAKGVCARCYNYVAQGLPVPPLEEFVAVEKKATEFFTMDSVIAAAGQAMEAPEQIGKADDYRLEDILTDPPFVSHDMGGGKTAAGVRSVLDLSSFKDGPMLMEWLLSLAEEDDTRTAEGHALDILRAHKKARAIMRRECQCGA